MAFHGTLYANKIDADVAGIEESRRHGPVQAQWCGQCSGYHLVKAKKEEDTNVRGQQNHHPGRRGPRSGGRSDRGGSRR